MNMCIDFFFKYMSEGWVVKGYLLKIEEWEMFPRREEK